MTGKQKKQNKKAGDIFPGQRGDAVHEFLWRAKHAGEEFLYRAVRILYPPRCPFCDRLLTGGERETLVCPDCFSKLEFADGDYCLKCGRPLFSETAEYCPECRHRRHYFDQARSLLVYQGDTAHSLNRLKSANRRDLADFYIRYLVKSYGRWIDEKKIDLILPVPMYPKKKRERGYNQAELLARGIGRQTKIREEEKVLVKVSDTRQQKQLNAAERRENMRDAFSVREDERIRGARILLVDDIYTTGATTDMAARVLKQGGAEKVYVLTAAVAGRQ